MFVTGEGLTPKALTMHDGRLTLNEALGESGGISPLSGDARQIYVVRKTPERTRVFRLDARIPYPRRPYPPIVSVPFDPRAVGGPIEEPAFDLKGYLDTLYNRFGSAGQIGFCAS